MTPHQAATRRLTGMLGPREQAEGLREHGRWASELIVQMRFLEDIGFSVGVDLRPRQPSVSYQRVDRLVAFGLHPSMLHPSGRELSAVLLQPGGPEGGWSLGPSLVLERTTGGGQTSEQDPEAIAQAVAVWRTTLEQNVSLLDDSLPARDRLELAAASLPRAVLPPPPPAMSNEELKRQPWWWHRYTVVLTDLAGASFSYDMVTNEGPSKALRWAQEAGGKKLGPVRTMTITDDGPIDVDEQGIAIIPDDAHDDRMEW